MSRAQIPILVLRGSPAERGRQHGAALQTLIAASISKLRKASSEQQWQRGRARSSLCLRQLAGSAPHLLAELEGIASATSTHVHGKPQQNAYVERYNRTVRHEWLDVSAVSAPLDWVYFEACCVCEKVSSFIWRFAWQMMDLLVATVGTKMIPKTRR
jgi:hypothetical protein